jgi:hypothetical protein
VSASINHVRFAHSWVNKKRDKKKEKKTTLSTNLKENDTTSKGILINGQTFYAGCCVKFFPQNILVTERNNQQSIELLIRVIYAPL